MKWLSKCNANRKHGQKGLGKVKNERKTNLQDFSEEVHVSPRRRRKASNSRPQYKAVNAKLMALLCDIFP